MVCENGKDILFPDTQLSASWMALKNLARPFRDTQLRF